MKPLDKALKKVEQQLLDKAAEEKKLKPILDKALYEIKKIEGKQNFFIEKGIALEKERQRLLKDFNDLLELSMQEKHSLKCGFTAMPDNNFKSKVKSNIEFLAWIKKNKSPSEVIEFLDGALKISAVKKFVDKEINNQRSKGIMEPNIDGIEIGEMSYRRLKTLTKKGK